MPKEQKEFRINEFITLRLEKSKTIIYISDKPFMRFLKPNKYYEAVKDFIINY